MKTTQESAILQHTFNISLTRIHKLLTCPLYLSQWWAPPGYRFGFTASVFSIGHPFHYTLLSTVGIETHHHLLYHEINPAYLSFTHTHNTTNEFPNTHNTISLTEKNDTTHLTWQATPEVNHPDAHKEVNTITEALIQRLHLQLKK